MCGIFGFFQQEGSSLNKDTVTQMSHILRHRGPDDEGALLIGRKKLLPVGGNDTPSKIFIAEPNFLPRKRLTDIENIEPFSHILGHRRLAIQDLSPLGHQPMCYEERYWVVYNGEIYNYIELRKELEDLGHNFISHSDTEVLLAAYSEWGTDCLHRFNGMWSFVIYDNETKFVFISRDRFGVKPLYYYNNGEYFIFASEIKALFCHPSVHKTENYEYLNSYIKWGPKEHLRETAFKDVLRIENAHYIFCSVDDLIKGDFEQQNYWKLNPNCSNETFSPIRAQELAKQYRDLLEDAVRIRMRADVIVGSALSGGLDSSSIVYLVNKLLLESNQKDMQKTFSCVYKSSGTEDCDEGIYIDQLAKHFGVQSNQIEPMVNNVPQEHRKMIWAMDTPPENTLMSSWHTFKKVSETKVRVTLDGQGADEQLAGYLGYIHLHLACLSLSELFRESIAFWTVPGAKKHVVAGILFNFLISFGLYKIANYIYKIIKGRKLEYRLNRKLVEDCMSSMITLIHYADRTSMAYSIESRMPFLDYRVAEFLATVPACYKIHRGWTKYLARLAFEDVLPTNVCWRKDKMGWPIPERYWFSGSLKPWYLSIIKSSIIIKLWPNIDCNPNNAPRSLKALNIANWENVFNLK